MLQGSLDTVSLDEVLGFLASSSKTGVLRLSGDRGTGSVWVQDGQIVGAEATHGCNEPALEEVIFELLRFSTGTFSFDFDEVISNAGAPMAIEGVLAQANKLLVEWRGIELIVPGLDYRVTPTPSLPAEQVTITEDEWATLLTVGPNASVEEVSNGLRLGELEGLRRLKGLIERKLILLSEPPAASLSAETAMSVEPDQIEVQPKATPPAVDDDYVDAATDEGPAGQEVEAEVFEPGPVAEDSIETPVAGESPVVENVIGDLAPESEPHKTIFNESHGDAELLNVPPPIAPSARRLSIKRGSVAKSEPVAQEAKALPVVESESAMPAPPPSIPEVPVVEESMSDPFASGDARPPMPPPPPMPSAPSGMAPPTGADVPPPPAPPSPAEIAKFGTSVDDVSSLDEVSAKSESSLLMRYLQSEG